MKTEALLQRLIDVRSRLQAIEGMIQQQVDEKIDGQRQSYNWSKIIPTISEEAAAGIEDIEKTLRDVGEKDIIE